VQRASLGWEQRAQQGHAVPAPRPTFFARQAAA
jgi:hypothetical protein